jgi:hypothetical protein
MTPTELLEFQIKNYEAKYPSEPSPLTYLIGRTAEEVLDAFKLAKGKKLTSNHFILGKRKQKKLEKQFALETEQGF